MAKKAVPAPVVPKVAPKVAPKPQAKFSAGVNVGSGAKLSQSVSSGQAPVQKAKESGSFRVNPTIGENKMAPQGQKLGAFVASLAVRPSTRNVSVGTRSIPLGVRVRQGASKFFSRRNKSNPFA